MSDRQPVGEKCLVPDVARVFTEFHRTNSSLRTFDFDPLDSFVTFLDDPKPNMLVADVRPYHVTQWIADNGSLAQFAQLLMPGVGWLSDEPAAVPAAVSVLEILLSPSARRQLSRVPRQFGVPMRFNVTGVFEINPPHVRVGQRWALENDLVTGGQGGRGLCMASCRASHPASKAERHRVGSLPRTVP
jgi:hypothetical protein